MEKTISVSFSSCPTSSPISSWMSWTIGVVVALASAGLWTSCGVAETLTERVSSNNDDAEESSTGTMNLSNSTLRLGQQRWVGLRFHDFGLPKGCTIISAHLELTATSTNSEATQLTICGQAHDDAPAFGSGSNYITNLGKTASSISWSDVESWTSGQTYESPDISQVIQELVDRTGWATNSDVNILIRSESLSGNRATVSANASTTTSVLLYVDYTTSVPSTTPTSDRLYVEHCASRKATMANAWQTLDLSVSPYDVPASKVVEIAILNTDASNEHWGGVRAVGSSLERRLQLHEADGGGIDAVVMHVQCDTSSRIEIYASSTSFVSFVLLGYWTSGTYTEKFQSFTVSSSATWQDLNLGPYGVGANQVAEVAMTNSNASNERDCGVRTKGSSLARITTTHEAEQGGIDAATMFVRASKSSNATVQAYASVAADVTFYLVGYWKRPPGKFTETYVNLGVPTSTSNWQDKSLSSSGVPAKAVAEIQLGNQDTGAEKYYGVRENGSSNDRRFLPHKAMDGGGDYVRAHVTTDSSSIIEWYSATTDANKVDVLLTGYWEAAPGDVLVIVADKQTPSTQALERLTLLEGWGYTTSLIDDDDPQSDFNAAFTHYNLAYVPVEVNAAVGAKVSGASLGIVTEHADLVDDFGFAAGSTATSGTSLSVVDTTHYIVSPFAAGPLTIFASSQPVTCLAGQQSSHVGIPGTWSSAAGLVTLEAGGKKYPSGRAMGRRVKLPWGGTSFDITALNNNGKTILQRSLQWASGLKGYWKFDESSGTLASDSSGHGNHATLSSGLNFSSAAVASARVKGGLSLNGTNGYIAARASPSLEITSAITMSAWIRLDAAGTAYLFDKGNQSSYYLRINADGSFTVGNSSSGWQATSNAGLLLVGKWQQVAATYNSATGVATLYIDGAVVKTQTGLSGAAGINSAALAIGSNNVGDGGRIAGTIDEMRIFNYALGASEVAVLKGIGIKGVRIIKWEEIP